MTSIVIIIINKNTTTYVIQKLQTTTFPPACLHDAMLLFQCVG